MKKIILGLIAFSSVSAFAADSCSVYIKQNDRVTSYADISNVALDQCEEIANQAMRACKASVDCTGYGIKRVVAQHKTIVGNKAISTTVVLNP